MLSDRNCEACYEVDGDLFGEAGGSFVVIVISGHFSSRYLQDLLIVRGLWQLSIYRENEAAVLILGS